MSAGSTLIRSSRWAWVGVLVASLVALVSSRADAAFRYGPIQISGNVEAKNFIRLNNGRGRFGSFNLVTQRNTVRLQYEHKLIERGSFLGGAQVPFIRKADLFTYYRFVYDSIYDIAPGPRIREQTGGVAGSISDIGNTSDIAFENRLREIYLDIDMVPLEAFGQRFPVNFRIGRQQIVWGEAIAFRAVDTWNPLDLTWHLQQEAGLLGRVGWSELRIPLWAFKMLIQLPRFGPISNPYLEIVDIPFDFRPTKLRFHPFPWSVATRDPFRAGLVLDLGAADPNLPEGNPALFFQPCFDASGSTESNSTVNPEFSGDSGFCNASNRPVSRLTQGLYDRRNPLENNEVGVRFGARGPFGVDFSLIYQYHRLRTGVPGAAAAKAQVGALGARPEDFLEIAPHETTDPATGETTQVTGFLRIPIEFYYPYVHKVGVTANYFDEYTSAVWVGNAAWTHNFPVATLRPDGNAQRRVEAVHGTFGFDRPTWIRALNPRSTFLIILQNYFAWFPEHEDLEFDDDGFPLKGDVGLPNSDLIAGQFGAEDRIDRLKSLEMLTLLVGSTFYWGGSLAPIGGVVYDWMNAPSFAFILGVEYLPTPNIKIFPILRHFETLGRTVDDPWGAGGMNVQRDELEITITYQF